MMEKNPRDKLTAREREVASQVARGLSNKEIARKLGISDGTVKLHVHRIFFKTKLKHRYQIIAAMMNGGLLHGQTRDTRGSNSAHQTTQGNSGTHSGHDGRPGTCDNQERPGEDT
jgi:DNA-binding CsgD family transcriptional regulator